MKKLLAIMMMALPILASGQKIVKRETDKFTGQHVISTSQEAIVKRNKWKNEWQQVLVSIRCVNGEWVMPAFIELNDIEKYDRNSQIILLLENGEKVISPSLYTGIGAEDCPIGIGGVSSRVHGFSTVFPLAESDVELLRKHSITDIRISPLGCNYDFEIGDKEQGLIKRMIKLVDDALSK